MDLEEFTTNLVKEEFGGYIVDLRFSGPYEDEDLDVDVILKEKPVDSEERMLNVFRILLDEDLDVLIDYIVDDELGQNC
ncbi:TPA: hypothetical protein EYP66_11915 [Candidatus Poribacteria bacterium]|nr:hypothetical protein [Candidatus Poribacteria bacterium]